jgi:hypothetical protein
MAASVRPIILAGAAALMFALAASSCGSGSSPRTSAAPAPAGVEHYAGGTRSDLRRALSLGFDVMDVAGSTSDPGGTKRIVDSLPPGVRALIWVGNLDNTDCTTPGYTEAQVRALVDAMARDRKVYGYYIADEPHPLVCPRAAAEIRARADYVHERSSFQKAFIVVQDGSGPCGGSLGCEFRALQPASTHVDLVGLDPYPCHYDERGAAVPCDDHLIDERVAAATANGIAPDRIVPLFQAFGQSGRVGGPVYYRMPTPREFGEILATWRRLVPDPPLDYLYTLGVQCSTTCPAPQSLANHPELQPLVRAHNRAGAIARARKPTGTSARQ